LHFMRVQSGPDLVRPKATGLTNYYFRTSMSFQHPKNQYEIEQQKLREEELHWQQIADKQHFRLQVIQSVLIILAFVAFWSWLIFNPISA
jgi:hypothetical protein